MFYSMMHSTHFIFTVIWHQTGKGIFRLREKKPAATITWATLSGLLNAEVLALPTLNSKTKLPYIMPL